MYMDPFEYMRKMQEEMDAAFDRFFNRRSQLLSLPFTAEEEKSLALVKKEPLMDIIDEKDHYKVVMEMPGINKEDIDVQVSEDALTVKAEVKHEEKKENEGYYYRERRYGSFQRTIALPGEVVPEQTKAEYKNGILELRLKKKEGGKTKQHRVVIN